MTHIVAFRAGESVQHWRSDGRLHARGGRRSKLFGRALRVCSPRPRHSAPSATSWWSTSSRRRRSRRLCWSCRPFWTPCGTHRGRPPRYASLSTVMHANDCFSFILYCLAGHHKSQHTYVALHRNSQCCHRRSAHRHHTCTRGIIYVYKSIRKSKRWMLGPQYTCTFFTDDRYLLLQSI